jgi:hypothetical protein
MSAFDVDLVSGDEGRYEEDEAESNGFDGEEDTPIEVDDQDTKPSATRVGNSRIKVEGETTESKKGNMGSSTGGKAVGPPGNNDQSIRRELERKRSAEDEREISELRARQRERNKEDKRREEGEQQGTVKHDNNKVERREREERRVLDRGPGNSKMKAHDKFEDTRENTYPGASKINKMNTPKPRERGREIGSEEYLSLSDGTKVSSMIPTFGTLISLYLTMRGGYSMIR